MKALIFLFYVSIVQTLMAQKPIIDSIAVVNWKTLGYSASISNDGNYFLYTIGNHKHSADKLIVQNTTNNWKYEFFGAESGFFTGDNKQVIFKRNDTLYFFQLDTKRFTSIAYVNDYKQPETNKEKMAGLSTKKSIK